MTISDCTTWECFNSFASWLSAIGTILISGLALWLSVRDRLINLQADLDVGLVPGSDPSILNKRVFILSFTNAGPRPVTITNHFWKLPFSHDQMIMLFPHLDPTVGHLCSRLPIELTDGKGGYAFYPIDFFQSRIEKPQEVFFPKNKVKAWLRIHFFSLKVGTSIGKRIKVKIKPAVRATLWKQYNETYLFCGQKPIEKQRND